MGRVGVSGVVADHGEAPVIRATLTVILATIGGLLMASTFSGSQVYVMALLGAALWLELRERRGA